MSLHRLPPCLLLLMVCVSAASGASELPAGDRLLREYFRRETAYLSGRCLTGVKRLSDWTERRDEYRRQLAEMVGLAPFPERTPLNPLITGRAEQEGVTVERLRFESRPGLYVTGDVYLPKHAAGPAPAILYLCGHANVKQNGVSYGAKVHYQHHGAWLAQHGYVCLIIDNLELGEIEGQHHGTFREGMWWWNGRGYTPAGVETWNGIRALDYLQSRPEVDPNRIGVTGRSGGGAYTWYLTALDDRVKVAVPTAGITDLQNYVVDGCVEGHCDCMFTVNTYRWDYPQVAAMVAPRPLLIENSDRDTIFPLDGVERLHAKVRELYRLYGAEKNLALTITPGAHEDTQELQVPMLRWFDRHLIGETRLLDVAARPLFEPDQLRVLSTIPPDQRNTTIHQTFVAAAPAPMPPADRVACERQRDAWMKALREKSFAGWPAEGAALEPQRVRSADRPDGLEAWDFTSQEGLPLRLYLLPAAKKAREERVCLRVVTPAEWSTWAAAWSRGDSGLFGGAGPPAGPRARDRFLSAHPVPAGAALAVIAPRGVGLTAWSGSPQQRTQIRRRFMLLGQTLDGMRVWDVRRAIQLTRSLRPGLPIRLQASGEMAGVALYASLFEPRLECLELRGLPSSGAAGPDLLNLLRYLDTAQALAMAGERCPVHADSATTEAVRYAQEVGKRLAWGARRFELDAP